MHKAAALVSLLVLGFSWTLQGLPTPPERLHTQENLDMEKVGEKHPNDETVSPTGGIKESLERHDVSSAWINGTILGCERWHEDKISPQSVCSPLMFKSARVNPF